MGCLVLFTVAFETLGCRLNQAETALFARQFLSGGYRLADDTATADLCIINTCTLTHHATSKCRRLIRSIIRRNPGACVAAVGCYSQTSVDELKTIPGLDYIIGTADKMRLHEIIPEPVKLPEPKVVHKPAAREHFRIDSVGYYPARTRANLKIQEGCSFVCSFCIVPKSRGPARSRDFDDIMREARALVSEGQREIVITGVNVGTYNGRGRLLSDVVDGLESIEDLDRIRLSSIEPTTIAGTLVDRMTPRGKLCPYLHIPLQSGDDRVLARMRRRYTVADYLEFIGGVRSRLPGIGLGTDVMVGFPGEDEEAFEATCRVVESIPLVNVHVFGFSARQGTGAWGMPDRVPGGEIARRSRLLHGIVERKKRELYSQQKGRFLRVLFEERVPGGYFVGFSDDYIKVGVPTESDLSNRLGVVEVTGIVTPAKDHHVPLLAVGKLVDLCNSPRGRGTERRPSRSRQTG